MQEGEKTSEPTMSKARKTQRSTLTADKLSH